MREGMLCGMWEGPLGISVAPGLPPACSPAVRSSSACSSSASVGVGCRGWVGGKTGTECAWSIVTQRTREGRSQRTKKLAKSDAHPCYVGNVSKTRPQTHRPVAQ